MNTEKSKCRSWNHHDYKLCFSHPSLELELVLGCEFLSSYSIIFKSSLLHTIVVIMTLSCSECRYFFQHFVMSTGGAMC